MAMKLFLDNDTSGKSRSDEDGAIPMGLYLIAACRIIFCTLYICFKECRRLLMDKDKNGNTILALALIQHLYNKGAISEHVYKNIKKEYQINTGHVTISQNHGIINT